MEKVTDVERKTWRVNWRWVGWHALWKVLKNVGIKVKLIFFLNFFVPKWRIQIKVLKTICSFQTTLLNYVSSQMALRFFLTIFRCWIPTSWSCHKTLYDTAAGKVFYPTLYPLRFYNHLNLWQTIKITYDNKVPFI